ncbi:bifunctional diaminohydroxyphosphoribosylaminopyrimidine deaminase/5-amino-6-(5-phosphoribosylamino)uracil reductase RibD [Corynebacterium auris]|uniref:bifunctional diaminohydroxyphosphoribosylaminopyrimidine deaminase/5-amino-6-(5-phosphoribosylamino)uracil reductase RibD n=1 Tax=Corynebacterium auris TaxID=44750 RepID=UPI0025B4C6B4|nr:bifunctional diaminohydroxyphosphoribosylaminopyrimidine deaminase/5-amino-6-(5-phosphoribosylamino)uracil reductase RibD [Corynebacterium auris]WJY68127.1 Riboflavin biosynthesis protein RibD [Corynebacterium auris]
MFPDVEQALRAGDSVRGTTSPNPPVGCALFGPGGELISTGATSPAGGPHAEIHALRRAGDKARGATLVVTLEPCNHTGRTGPCSEALVAAGVSRVIYLTADPNPQAAGGAEYLREHGIAAEYVPTRVEALQPWLASVRHGRVSVTAKFAATADGFTAAPDGSSQWITGDEARQHVHADRAGRDAILIGTGTALADNPSLTARHPDGTLMPRQPRRVVVGAREVPEGNLTRLGFEQYATPEEALDTLWATGARDVLVEGGAGLLTSVFALGVVDRVQAYLAPMVLGGGRGVVTRALAPTLAAAPRFQLSGLHRLGQDVLMEMER